MTTVDPDTEGTELNNLGNEVDQTTDATGDRETNVDLLEDQHEDGGFHSLAAGSATHWDDYLDNTDTVVTLGAKKDSLERIRTVDKVFSGQLKRDMTSTALGFRVEPEAGPSSRDLVNRMSLYRTSVGRKITGALFDGKQLIVSDGVDGRGNPKYRLSSSKKYGKEVGELRSLADKARMEWESKSFRADLVRGVDPNAGAAVFRDLASRVDPTILNTADGAEPSGGQDIEMESLVSDEAEEEVAVNLAQRLSEAMSDSTISVSSLAETLDIPNVGEIMRPIGRAVLDMSDEDFREAMGVLGIVIADQRGLTVDGRLEVLGIEITYWEKKAEEEDNPKMKRFYESVVRVGKLTQDYVRVRNGLKPEWEEALGMLGEVIEASDELRLSRFKRWAKENLLGISAVAISAAGLATGLVMASRSALKVGAKGLGKFAGAVARVFKKLGPFFAAVGSLVSTILSWGAKGILWMANNLWFLVVAILAALYSEYGRRRAAAAAKQ